MVEVGGNSKILQSCAFRPPSWVNSMLLIQKRLDMAWGEAGLAVQYTGGGRRAQYIDNVERETHNRWFWVVSGCPTYSGCVLWESSPCFPFKVRVGYYNQVFWQNFSPGLLSEPFAEKLSMYLTACRFPILLDEAQGAGREMSMENSDIPVLRKKGRY